MTHLNRLNRCDRELMGQLNRCDRELREIGESVYVISRRMKLIHPECTLKLVTDDITLRILIKSTTFLNPKIPP